MFTFPAISSDNINTKYKMTGSWDSIVGTLTRPWDGQSSVQLSVAAKDFSLFPIAADPPPIQWALEFLPHHKAARHEVKNSTFIFISIYIQ
jgi:hypothetical protein